MSSSAKSKMAPANGLHHRRKQVAAAASSSSSNKTTTSSSPSAASSRQASQTSLITSGCLTAQPKRSQMSRGSSATSVALSDTQLSSVSSSAAGLQRRLVGSATAPPALKKSSSSMSSASAASAAKQTTADKKSTTGLSFSGIRRPVSGGGGGPHRTSAFIGASQQSAVVAKPICSVASQRVPTLAMSLRDKDQQIKLLIKERDEQKFQAELLARRAEEWREKFEASELERTHMTSEADDEVVELRRLAQEFEDENKRLAERLLQREQLVSDTQFKLDEMDCERQELRRELGEREQQLEELEQERRDLLAGARTGPELVTERQISRAKFEREIEQLKEKLMQKDESMMQLRSSLEMRKNEANNLQSMATDLERKLKIETERSERHLKRIDEINLELRAAEEKLATKTEENEIQEKQVKQLRQEVRSVEEKLEQLSLARKKDVDILHCKLSAARGNACRSATPTGSQQQQQQAYKTPTPQDEIVRLQMDIRDLKDLLIDREAELDCNRRDLEVMRRKMETRTLEVDCNNQELARRCQDLLEQNRQSEDTVKQLLKSTTEHSAQLMRATEDLKEANGKCIRLRDEVNELEAKLDDEMKQGAILQRENKQLNEDNQLQLEQIDQLRQQVETLNEQLTELCQQLDVQSQNLHKDREQLADQLSEHEINSAQLRHDLAAVKQDLRTSKLQTQEVATERDRLRSDLDMKEKYIRSRNDIIEQMRHELDDSQKSLAEYKSKLETLRAEFETQLEERTKDFQARLQQIKLDLQTKSDECLALEQECQELETKLAEAMDKQEQVEDEKFDEMRRKHSEELDELKLKLIELEKQLDNGRKLNTNETTEVDGSRVDTQTPDAAQRTLDYETQIEFLNSLVVEMQRKADDYKNRLASLEAVKLTNGFALNEQQKQDNMEQQQQQHAATFGKTSTLKRNEQTNTVKRHVRIQDPIDGQISSLTRVTKSEGENEDEDKEEQLAAIEQQLFSDKTSYNNGKPAAEARVPMRHISGRPFCDICQIYDLHHTIYCPHLSEKLGAKRATTVSNDDPQSNSDQTMNNNNYISPNNVDEMFREYEESLESAASQFYPQFASLRRPTNTVNGTTRRQI